ncbi:FAD-dependent oxidoreductase [Kribbella sp. GL6]|uniref:FAD-dependent oxidoreductase n=1 Tax=Kribbella sp. GL6 TaxID=3419765 RepID=UPI003D052F54
MDDQTAPIVVIGAGPIGLAAAAHLAERGLNFAVLESGPTVASAIEEWRHVKLFSPWRYDIDPAACRLLQQTAWPEPDPTTLPTGGDLIDAYLQPLTKTPELNNHIRYNTRVVAITRIGYDRLRTAGREAAPFLLRLADGTDLLASAVIDASGTWHTPNVLGASGIPAHGELSLPQTPPHTPSTQGTTHAPPITTGTHPAAHTSQNPLSPDRVTPAFPSTPGFGSIAHALPDVLGADRDRYARRRTAVVGAGHSAATTLIDLGRLADAEPGTEIAWVVRGDDQARTYGGGDADELPARGALGSRLKELVRSGRVELISSFRIESVGTANGRVVLTAGERTVVADTVVNSTGFRPDHTIVSELRLDLDPILGSTRALAPLIDPNQHSCGTVPPHGVDELTHPEPGYYAIGAKSYGRAPTFLLATGYEQARSVVAALAGDWRAARDVQLNLPQTGVCSSNLAYGNSTTESTTCCAPTPQPANTTTPTPHTPATNLSVAGLLPLINNTPNPTTCCD